MLRFGQKWRWFEPGYTLYSGTGTGSTIDISSYITSKTKALIVSLRTGNNAYNRNYGYTYFSGNYNSLAVDYRLNHSNSNLAAHHFGIIPLANGDTNLVCAFLSAISGGAADINQLFLLGTIEGTSGPSDFDCFDLIPLTSHTIISGGSATAWTTVSPNCPPNTIGVIGLSYQSLTGAAGTNFFVRGGASKYTNVFTQSIYEGGVGSTVQGTWFMGIPFENESFQYYKAGAYNFNFYGLYWIVKAKGKYGYSFGNVLNTDITLASASSPPSGVVTLNIPGVKNGDLVKLDFIDDLDNGYNGNVGGVVARTDYPAYSWSAGHIYTSVATSGIYARGPSWVIASGDEEVNFYFYANPGDYTLKLKGIVPRVKL